MTPAPPPPPATLPATLLLTAALASALVLGLPGPLAPSGTDPAPEPSEAARWGMVAVATLSWFLSAQVYWRRRAHMAGLLAAAVAVQLASTLLNPFFGLSTMIYQGQPLSAALDTLFFLLVGAAQLHAMSWLRRSGRWPGPLVVTDTLMLATVAGMGLWALGLGTLVTGASEQRPLLAALMLAYMAAQLLVGALALMLRDLYRQMTRLVAAGLLCFILADLYTAAVLPRSSAGEPWVLLLWVWGMTLLALGIDRMGAFMHPPRPIPPLPPRLLRGQRRLPYAATLICCTLLLAGALEGTPQQLGISLGTVAVFGLVMARQASIMQANRQMQNQLEASRRELEHLAYHDPLTGLPNRASLNHFFETQLGLDEPYAIFSLDLNGFKQINDTYGHAAGDQMLRHAARQLERAIAAPGRVFRWGGDEFVIVVPGVQRNADADSLARFIAANIRAPLAYQGKPLSVGTSVGYALGRGRQAYEALLVLADHDMYHLKGRHKGGHQAGG